MGGSTNRQIAEALHNPNASSNSTQWARNVCEAHHAGIQLHKTFTPAERYTADCMAPRGNTIFSSGDPSTVVEDLPATIEDDQLPDLLECTGAPKGIRFIAAKIKKLMEWRRFFDLH